MTQFKDHVSEGLCFQILNMQFCLFPCHGKPRLMKWSNLWKLFLQRTLEAGISSVTSFHLGIPCPYREASAHPWAQFHLLFSHLSDHLSLSTGWHPANIDTTHRPLPSHWHSEPSLPIPLPDQHSKTKAARSKCGIQVRRLQVDQTGCLSPAEMTFQLC